MNTVSLDEFTTDHATIFSRVKKTGLPVMITDRGINLAEIHPPSVSGKQPRQFGSMRDSVKIAGDIISPASDTDEWEVLRD